MLGSIRLFLVLLSSLVVLGQHAVGAPVSDVTFACANGQIYGLRPHSLTIKGDIVTGYLLHGPGTTQKVRLIPMGDGYRYSGIGIWLDGVRENATLNIGPAVSIPCQRSFSE
jgi:hypothetical protein